MVWRQTFTWQMSLYLSTVTRQVIIENYQLNRYLRLMIREISTVLNVPVSKFMAWQMYWCWLSSAVAFNIKSPSPSTLYLESKKKNHQKKAKISIKPPKMCTICGFISVDQDLRVAVPRLAIHHHVPALFALHQGWGVYDRDRIWKMRKLCTKTLNVASFRLAI